MNIGARAYAGRFFEGGRAIWGAYGKQAAAPAARGFNLPTVRQITIRGNHVYPRKDRCDDVSVITDFTSRKNSHLNPISSTNERIPPYQPVTSIHLLKEDLLKENQTRIDIS